MGAQCPRVQKLPHLEQTQGPGNNQTLKMIHKLVTMITTPSGMFIVDPAKVLGDSSLFPHRHRRKSSYLHLVTYNRDKVTPLGIKTLLVGERLEGDAKLFSE